MYVARLHSWLLIPCLAAILAVGCGEGNTLSSPTAPSMLSDADSLTTGDTPAVADTASTAGDFSPLGRGSGKDKDKGKGSDKGKGGGHSGESEDDDDDDDDEDEDEDDDEDNSGPGRGNRGQVSGFVTAVGADSITIRGITVKITNATVIRHGNRRLMITDVHIGDHAQARGTRSADGMTLTATEVKVEDTGRNNDEDDDEVKIEGLVSAFSGTTECPSKSTFTVGITKVTTNASTRFENVTCQTLANGMRVEVEGTRQTDGSILATKVKSKVDEVEGLISAFSGTTECPKSTFTVGTTKVTTDSSTKFEDVTCQTLADGMRVEVEGTRQTDGSILAAKVERELDKVEGMVSGLDTTGTCPDRTFTVGTTKVTTSTATTFSGGACAELMNLTRVEVEGTKQTDGSIAATSVRLRLDEVKGTISGLDPTTAAGCPSRTFTVGATKVTTSSVTTFSGVTCAALANGTQVEVKGTKQTDGSIAAARVELD